MLCKELRGHGFHFHFITNEGGATKKLCQLGEVEPLRGWRETAYSLREPPYEGLKATLKHLLKKEPCDFIWINHLELVPSVYKILRELGRTDMHERIVAHVHFLPTIGKHASDPYWHPVPIKKELCIRIAAGVQLAKAIIVPSPFALQHLDQIVEYAGYEDSINDLLDRAIVVPPPISAEEIARGIREGKCVINKKDGVTRLILSSRLRREYVGWLIEEIGRIARRIPIELVITEPRRRGSAKSHINPFTQQCLDKVRRLPFVVWKPIPNRLDYYATIRWAIRIGIANIRRDTLWSMAAAEVMACGKPCVAPRTPGYEWFVPDELLYESRDEFSDIVVKLAVDEALRLKLGRKAREKIMKKAEVKIVAKEFRQRVKRRLNF